MRSNSGSGSVTDHERRREGIAWGNRPHMVLNKVDDVVVELPHVGEL